MHFYFFSVWSDTIVDSLLESIGKFYDFHYDYLYYGTRQILFSFALWHDHSSRPICNANLSTFATLLCPTLFCPCSILYIVHTTDHDISRILISGYSNQSGLEQLLYNLVRNYIYVHDIIWTNNITVSYYYILIHILNEKLFPLVKAKNDY